MAYGGRLVVNDESGCVCEEVVVAILKHYTEMSKWIEESNEKSEWGWQVPDRDSNRVPFECELHSRHLL